MGKHLTFEQRCQLAVLHEAGLTQTAIATRIGVNQPAVCRELRRNGASDDYACRTAHEAAWSRRMAASSSARKMTPQVTRLIETMPRRQEWSPSRSAAVFPGRRLRQLQNDQV